MKSIIFLTDTHGNLKDIKRLTEEFKRADYVFFAGDNYRDFNFLEEQLGGKLYRVKGNCDFFSEGETELTVKVEEVKFLLTHGHKFSVKSSLLRLRLYAEEKGYNAVCFGHTHCATVDNIGSALLINAGNLTGYGEKTYAEITVNGGSVRAEIKRLI